MSNDSKFTLHWTRLLLCLNLLFGLDLSKKQNSFAQSASSDPIQESAKPTDDVSEADIIVREDLIQSKTVKLRHNNLEDFLQEQGINTLSMGGEASRLELQLRGSSGAQAGIYLDQIPLHGLRARAIDLNLFALDLFQEVQVQTGGRGAKDGSGAMAGSIRFIPKSITQSFSSSQIKLNTSTQGYGQISGLTQNQFGQKYQTLLAISVSAGPNRYPYTDQYGFNRRRAYSDFRRVAGLGQIESEWHHWKLVTLLGAGDLNRGEPGPETFSLPQRRSQQYARFCSLSAYSPELRLNQSIVYAVIHSSFLSSYYGFNEAYPLWQSEANANNKFHDQRYLFKLKLNHEYGSWKNALMIELSETQAQVSSLKAQRIQSAIIPSIKYSLSKELSIDIASRLDLNTERGAEVVPSINLMYQQAKMSAWRSWITWSRVWRDPGFDELYLVGPSLIPNPNLKPELGHWLEWGSAKSLNHKFDSLRLKLKLSIKLFFQEFKQLIHYVPIDPYRIRAENIDGARYYGIEHQLDARIIIKRYQVMSQSHINLLKHQLTSTPFTALPLRPQATANTRLTIRKRLKQGSIELWGSLQYRGETTLDLFAERSLSARTIFDLGINRIWRSRSNHENNSSNYQLSIKLKNLSNQNQYNFALQPIPGRSFWFAISKEF